MPETEQNPVKKEHLIYLDSVRGIAALMVLVYHYINWKYEDKLWAKFASIIFNGSDAVSFFFVLSGFVLTYKYLVLKQKMDIGKFYVNRFFRLWPAFFVTVVINALFWFRKELNFHYLADQFIFNKSQFWEEALLIRNPSKFYGAGWTLTIELTLSFLVPFTIVLAQKSVKLLWWYVLAFVLIGPVVILYQMHFVLGAIISCYFLYINGGGLKQKKWYKYRYLIIAAAFLLYSIRHIDRISPIGSTFMYLTKWYMGIDFFHYTGVASFVFLIAIINSARTKLVLEHTIFRFFGKISYGIYLMHWVVISASFEYFNLWAGFFPNAKIEFICRLAGCFVVTTGLALLIHYLVELPFIKLGKKLTGRMRPGYIINPE